MIRSLALTAALAALALPAATSAQDTADPAWASFQQICWDTAGDYLGAVKAAGAGGWAGGFAETANNRRIELQARFTF